MDSGTLLGHYRLLESLGKGGMGQVYLAEDTKLDRQVALKVLPPELGEDADRRERFIREAKAVAALNHPNIVVIHSVEEDEGRVFLTMERIEGAPLTHRIAGGAIPLDELFDLAIPLADAISAAHQKGIAHRDLKPDNVMVTPDGRLKVLDFGLAKIVEAEESQLSAAATAMLTEEGKILGTVAYMSPEQAQGKPVDARTDIFALGILLYEMATGRRPFDGDSKISVLSSLIKDTPAPVTEINQALPRHLGRIIRHCLEKDPERRYQSALDVRNELESLREEIRSGEVDLPTGEYSSLSGSLAGESMPSTPHTGGISNPSTSGPGSATGEGMPSAGSGSHPGIPAPAAGGNGRRVVAGALVLFVAAIGWWFLGSRDADVPEPAVQTAAADARQSIAVLPFDNTSGAEDVEWLREGIAEMLVTDLSQATGLRVVGSERIREVLDELGRDADALDSMDTVREVAQRAGTTAVVTGSFVQAGDQLRISARLVDANSGEVTDGESVDGQGQDSVFASVDTLSRWIRRTVEPAEASASSTPIDRDLVDVTTGSVEAFRFYAEGLKRVDGGQYAEAIDFFEEAVRLDTEFALAYMKLSVTHGNLFNFDARDRYAERALEFADRLTDRERYYFEGVYYQRSDETVERAVAAYRRAVELYPDDTASRNNMATNLGALHRHEEAVEQLEETLRRGTTFGGTRTNLIENYLALGRLDDAARRAGEILEAEPDDPASHEGWLMVLMARGNYEEAGRVFDLHAQDFPILYRLGMGAALAFQRRDWDGALGMVARENPNAPIVGLFSAFVRRSVALYQGRSGDAINEMAAIPDSVGAFYWIGQLNAGETELERGDVASALERALDIRERAPDPAMRLNAVALAARARAALGRAAGVENLVAEYAGISARSESPHQERARRLLSGQLALIQGEATEALRELEAAAALLEAREYGDQENRYVDVHLAIGEAHLLAGDLPAARDAFLRVTDSGAVNTMSNPIAKVRAWYFLGHARDRLGDEAGAREAYETFVSYWADGDIDRDRVAEATAHLNR